MTNRHSAYYPNTSWMDIINQTTLAIFRGTAGWLTGSHALMSDAFVAGSEAVREALSKLPLSPNIKKDGDKRRTNLETSSKLLPAVLFSFCLLLAAAWIIYTSIARLISKPAGPNYIAGIAALLSLLLKEAAFQARLRQLRGTLEEKQRLTSEHRLAMTASFIVLIGVVGSMTGDITDNGFLLKLDPIAAVAAALILVINVIRTLVQAVSDAATEVPQIDNAKYLETAQRVYGVITADQLSVEEFGGSLLVYMRISVDPGITIQEANEVAARVKTLLLTRFSHLHDAEVSVAPFDPGYPYKSNQQKNEFDEPTLLQ